MLVVKIRRCSIVRRAFVDGRWWDADDLLGTLREVRSGGVTVDQGLGTMLVRIGVLRSRGSSNAGYPASEGPQFKRFLHQLERAHKDSALVTRASMASLRRVIKRRYRDGMPKLNRRSKIKRSKV